MLQRERLRDGYPEPFDVGRVEDAHKRQVQLLGLQRDLRRGRKDQGPARRGRTSGGGLHAVPNEQQKVKGAGFSPVYGF